MSQNVTARDLAGVLPGFFKNDDFKEKPPAVYTISGAGSEEVGKDRETKPVLHFAETNKALVLNATRARQLEDIFGSKPIVGEKIRLVFRAEKVNGKSYDMICIEAV